MGSKPKSVYICTECGGQASKWQGQCPRCSAWNTLIETVIEAVSKSRFASTTPSKLQSLGDVEAQELPYQPTGISEFDRVPGLHVENWLRS